MSNLEKQIQIPKICSNLTDYQKKPESQKIAHAQIELVKFCPYQQTLNKNKQKERKGKNVAEILAKNQNGNHTCNSKVKIA